MASIAYRFVVWFDTCVTVQWTLFDFLHTLRWCVVDDTLLILKKRNLWQTEFCCRMSRLIVALLKFHIANANASSACTKSLAIYYSESFTNWLMSAPSRKNSHTKSFGPMGEGAHQTETKLMLFIWFISSLISFFFAKRESGEHLQIDSKISSTENEKKRNKKQAKVVRIRISNIIMIIDRSLAPSSFLSGVCLWMGWLHRARRH